MKLAARILSLLSFGALLAWAGIGAPPVLTRGPYLQSVSSSAITVVCRTDSPTAVTVNFGEHAGPPWVGSVTSAVGTTHVFALSDLSPATRYVYELRAGDVLLARAGCSFTTSPPSASRAPFRFFAWGDFGTGTAAQLDVAASIERVRPAPDLALLLGDLVYEHGEWEGYDPRVFQPYAELFRSTPVWTTLGNHEVETDDGAPYFDAFYLPTDTGAPGEPSGTELYYSFDHGLAHFVCLDSESSDSSPGSPMYRWASDDLDHARASGKRWLFVFMHHPPYSRGTHDSTSETELIELHDNLVPLFDEKQVDLVMVGHSHVYERSFLIKEDAILQADETDYTKSASPDGTIYVVSGCGGQIGSGPLDLPVMARSYGDVNGFSVVDVSWSEVRGRFIERDGTTTDLFTLRKAADETPPRVSAVEVRSNDELVLTFDEPVRAGDGPGSAEDPARYVLDPPATILSAELDSDGSTLALGTTLLQANREYALDVQGVMDPLGHETAQRVEFARADDDSLAPHALVADPSAWRYLPGTSAPPADWAARGFDDSGWASSQSPFGYGYGDEATRLDDMRGNYATLYLRAAFEVPDPALVAALELDIAFDDGFVAFLNGVEIARSRVLSGQTNETEALGTNDGDEFQRFEADDFLGRLVAGTNVLAVEGHNTSVDGADFRLQPRLVLFTDGPGGPPRAVADTPTPVANAPARVAFSAARSTDEDGPLDAVEWDFGDGTGATGSEVEHLYADVGTFTATLKVRDADGLESVAPVEIRVHDDGTAPQAELTSATQHVAPGGSVSFDSAGSLDADGGAVTRRWDFGDPASGPRNTSSAVAPVHRYDAAGTYRVTLVITDDEGSSTTDTVNIDVSGSSGGGGGGGGGCSIADGGERRGGDPVLAATFVLALAALARALVRTRVAALARTR